LEVRLLSHSAVSLGCSVVAEVSVDRRSEPVRFRVMAFEKLDVPVQVGQRL